MKFFLRYLFPLSTAILMAGCPTVSESEHIGFRADDGKNLTSSLCESDMNNYLCTNHPVLYSVSLMSGFDCPDLYGHLKEHSPTEWRGRTRQCRAQASEARKAVNTLRRSNELIRALAWLESFNITSTDPRVAASQILSSGGSSALSQAISISASMCLLYTTRNREWTLYRVGENSEYRTVSSDVIEAELQSMTYMFCEIQNMPPDWD
jgi:hypothetical protein